MNYKRAHTTETFSKEQIKESLLTGCLSGLWLHQFGEFESNVASASSRCLYCLCNGGELPFFPHSTVA